MSKSISIIIACILLIVIFALFFMAGYEKGASSVERQILPANAVIDMPKSQNVENKEAGVANQLSSDSKVLSDKQIIKAQRLKVAASLLDDYKNELVDEINFEFTHSAPLIVSKDSKQDYTIDTLAEDVINDEKVVNVDELYSIRSEIFVYVGMFDEAGAVAASEYIQKIGFVPSIKYIRDNGVTYTFVVSGPLLLMEDAQMLVKYLKNAGYDSAKIIE